MKNLGNNPPYFYRFAAFFFPCSIILLLLAGICLDQAHAQDSHLSQTDLFDLPLSELLGVEISSATKRPNQIRNIPASITIVSREEIETFGYVTLTDLLKNIPGLYLFDSTADIKVGSRGIEGGGIQFLVNGIPQHPSRQKVLTLPEISQLNIPVESIDQLEFIRGPMSVMYGNNALLGIINIVTNSTENMDGETGGRISTSYGNNGRQRLFGRFQHSFDDGFLVFNGGRYATDGLDSNYSDMMTLEQQTTLDPAMNTSLEGHAEHEHNSLELSAAYKGFQADIRYSYMDYGLFTLTPGYLDGSNTKLTTWNSALTFNHSFSDRLSFKATGIYSDETYDGYDVIFATRLPNGTHLPIDGTFDQSSRRKDLELNLLYDPFVGLETMFGYRYRNINDVGQQLRLFPITWSDLKLKSFVQHDFFGQVSYDATSDLRLIGGVRLVRLPDQYKTTGYLFGITNAGPYYVVAETEDRNQFDGQIAALYSLGEHHLLKATYGTAAQDVFDETVYQPETVITTELNYTYTNDTNMLSTSLFHNEIENLNRIFIQDGLFIEDNNGEWRNYGIELIGEHRFTPHLTLGASFVWNESEDKTRNDRPEHSPEYLFKTKVSYRHGSLTYAFNVFYVNGMNVDWEFLNNKSGENVDSYWDLGANIRYQHPTNGFFANLNGSNLLDTEIRYPGNSDTLDLTRNLIGPGLTITATLGWDF